MVIDQFMWGYQPHFRIGIQTRAESAFDHAKGALDPQVFLVGFATDPNAAGHPICVEPERGTLQPHHLAGVLTRAEDIYSADPERAGFHTVASVDEAYHRALRRKARAQALVEAIHASGAMPGRTVFAGSGWRVDRFEVCVCIAVDSVRLEALPKLTSAYRYGYPMPPSFVESLIGVIVAEAEAALARPEPDNFAMRRSSDDLVRRAASDFLQGCLYRTQNPTLYELLPALNEITEQTYERAGASGRLLLVAPDHPDLEVASVLNNPIDPGSTRAVRKLLEMSDAELALLLHRSGVYGLGRLRTGTTAFGDDAFEIVVTGHATWELCVDRIPHIRVSYGKPTIPRAAFSPSWAKDIFRRVLDIDASASASLVELIDTASSAGHGTTLVVSADAAGEAERLLGQATLIAPQSLTPDLLRHFSRIDGAVLISPDGEVHAIGVILDGSVSDQGDPARGSRYNSAVRYQASAIAGTVVVVVSDDGNVDLIPPLRRQVHRQQILDAVSRVKAAHEADDRREAAEAIDAVRRLGFYLTEEQCDEINAIGHEQERRNSEGAGFVLVYQDLIPDLAFDNSYFKED
jgi:hypothetical protein